MEMFTRSEGLEKHGTLLFEKHALTHVVQYSDTHHISLQVVICCTCCDTCAPSRKNPSVAHFYFPPNKRGMSPRPRLCDDDSPVNSPMINASLTTHPVTLGQSERQRPSVRCILIILFAREILREKGNHCSCSIHPRAFINASTLLSLLLEIQLQQP